MRLSTSTNLMNFDARLPYMVSMPHAISALATAGYRFLDANLCGCSRRGRRFAPMTEDNWEQQVKDWRRQAGPCLLVGERAGRKRRCTWWRRR